MKQLKLAELMPHTGVMILLDRILDYDATGLTAELRVRDDGLLGDANQVPAWVGIEYMAQTIAVFSGITASKTKQSIGFLLGSRRYCSNVATFKVGAMLTITVNKHYQDTVLGVFDCQIYGDGVDVSAKVNVYLPPSTRQNNIA